MRPILLAALLLAGCAAETPPQSAPMLDGVEAAPPQGWFGYCLNHLAEDRCRPGPPLVGDRTPA